MAIKEGDRPTVVVTFVNSSGDPVDPAVVVLNIQRGDLANIGYLYGRRDDIVNPAWTPSANTLVDGTGTLGEYHVADADGAVDFGSGYIQFYAGDAAFYNGEHWRRVAQLDTSVDIVRQSAGTFVVPIYLGIGGRWRFEAESGTPYQSSAYLSLKVDTNQV